MSVGNRRPRVTLPQLECLWKFLNSHKDIATGYNKCATARETYKRLWKAIALNLNSFDGATKNWKEWTKYWNNYKSKLKIKIASALKSGAKNESGHTDWDCLTEIERKFLVILGKKYKSIIDGVMEDFEQESSDNSLDSVYDPETVPDLKAETQTATVNSGPSNSNTLNQTDSVFQQIFLEESSEDKSDLNGQCSDASSLSNHNIDSIETRRNSASNFKSTDALQRGFSSSHSVREPAVRPQRRGIPQRPRRRHMYQSEVPSGLDRALRMIVRASRRKTAVMERLLQEVIDMKELIKDRFPPVRPPLNDH